MFRKSKKRPPSHTLRASRLDGEDEEEEDTSHTLLAQDRRKVKRTVVRSDITKTRTTGGGINSLGFGGSDGTLGQEMDDQDEVEPESSNTQEEALYDPIALSQLRTEQNRYTEIQAAWSVDKEAANEDAMDDDFIALDKNGDEQQEATRILSGEEAILLETRLQGEDEDDIVNIREPSSLQKFAHLPTEDDEWEAQVAQRAGIGTGSRVRNEAYQNTHAMPSVGHEGNQMLNQLYSKVDSTLQHLNKQQADLKRAEGQREGEITTTRANMEKQENDMQQAGHAVEYYQELRMRLANWVGGLRQLQSKVQPIQEALHLLESEVSSCQRSREWEDDMVAVLFQHDLLEQVLGRQPDQSIFEQLASRTVDEFGRDVQSLYSLQREKRKKRRHLIQQQRSDNVRGDESDAFLLDDEKETFRERRKALQDALELALSGLDEDYTSLQNLVNVFEEWKRQYGEDYKQCHATLSLADLATPLIQAELCALNDPWNESGGYNESKWVAVIYSALESNVIDNDGVERIIEKAVIPSLSDLLDKSGFELLSFQQNKSLTEFWSHLKRVVRNEGSPVLIKIRHMMAQYVRRNLSDISIAIVKKHMMVDEPDNEELKDALKDAIVGQMHRIKKVLLNILSCWAPILGSDNDFVETVLSFVSGKFLSLLSSLQGFPQPRFQGTPIDVFQQVYRALETTEWLDNDDMMPLTIPIRAAASTYSKLEVSVS